ncbi:DUF2079 domain-containing protein [Anabaena sp. UHCC 0204]|uniref:DUF2079 domain-containing protein n=1 Tax=Anabaena sp. UHCC 0204 TaxID=2590009 RepID=UPI001445A5F0|nr:DUF2079 domain-containing protein [Anabaena sp. UHCC 0204]MTJ07040.1 DUF2079 domain-containing protein [Anabaena sp. UHCC 0204]
MEKEFMKPNPLVRIIGISAFILFVCSSIRHLLFQSTAWDLGIFDQAIYLISQGQVPISSFLNFHILGDHASGILYPLALLYKIYPSVYWLFAIQSVALSLGALPTYFIALQAGLKESQAVAMTAVYLLYPVVYNSNLFDFHPDAIAIPALLTMIFAAREKKIWQFCFSILIVLACKEVFSLTILAMGIWLMLCENRRFYGAIAIISGITWFVITTKGIIPYFGTEVASVERHLGRYNYLGSSFTEVVENLFSNPFILLDHIFSFDNLFYLALLLLPIIWGLSHQTITCLVGAIPCLAMNILANDQSQKDLIHQYSLPILPFLILGVIASLSLGKGFLQNKREIIIWSLLTFLCLAKFTHFTGKYLEYIDNLPATREAIALVKSQGGVYTTSVIAPHLSHRKLIKLTDQDSQNKDLDIFDYVLLNVRHPAGGGNQEFSKHLVQKLERNPKYQKQYQQDDVFLFVKN